jgi:hypothetical protein
MPGIPVLFTVGEIARRLGVELHRVEYVLRTRDIWPCSRAGNALVYTREDLDRVGSEIKRIDLEHAAQRAAAHDWESRHYEE